MQKHAESSLDNTSLLMTMSWRPSLQAAEICCHVRQSGSSFTAFGVSRHILP